MDTKSGVWGAAAVVAVLGVSATAYALSCVEEDPEIATLRLAEVRVDGQRVEPAADWEERVVEVSADNRDRSPADPGADPPAGPPGLWLNIEENGTANRLFVESYERVE